MTARRLALAALVLAIAAFFDLAYARHELHLSSYKAFYCAGQAIDRGANPYLVEPLRACEHRIAVQAHFPASAVEPAPLPGYALAPFALLALLPVQVSHAVFLALLALSLFVTGVALARVTGFWSVLVTMICLSAWLPSVSFGDIPPLCVAAIALCGLALERDRPWLAGLFACASTIEPHVAAPVVVALAIGAPKTRIPLIVGAALLGAVDLVVTGPHAAFAYFTTYLPAQGLAEVSETDQYSLTHLAHLAGFADGTALTLGALSYLLMTIAGVAAAIGLRKRFGMPAFLAFAPAAFALVGGTFVHGIQMMAALPLVLVLLARFRGGVPRVLAVAAALLAVTWGQAGSLSALLLAAASAFAVGMLLFEQATAPAIRSLAFSAAMTLALVGLHQLPARQDLPPPTPIARQSPTEPASQAWGALVRSDVYWSDNSPRSMITKIPTWLGLLLLAGFALGCGLRTGNDQV